MGAVTAISGPSDSRPLAPGGLPPDDDLLNRARNCRRRQSLGSWALRGLILAIFLGSWQAFSALKIANPVLISNPAAVAHSLATSLSSLPFWGDIWSTFEGAFLGLAVGSVLGIASGFALSRSAVLDRATRPFVTMANSLPRPALAPIVILWFGLGVWSKATVGASLAYFILLVNTRSGLKSIDTDIVQLAKSMNMRATQQFRLVELPHSLPAVVAGLRLGAVYSVLGVVVTEMVASYRGLGQVLVVDANNFDIGGFFAVVILLAVLASILDQIISAIERWIVHRR